MPFEVCVEANDEYNVAGLSTLVSVMCTTCSSFLEKMGITSMISWLGLVGLLGV